MVIQSLAALRRSRRVHLSSSLVTSIACPMVEFPWFISARAHARASLQLIRPNRAKNAIVCIEQFLSPDTPTAHHRTPICDILCVNWTQLAFLLPSSAARQEIVTEFVSSGQSLHLAGEPTGGDRVCVLPVTVVHQPQIHLSPRDTFSVTVNQKLGLQKSRLLRTVPVRACIPQRMYPGGSAHYL